MRPDLVLPSVPASVLPSAGPSVRRPLLALVVAGALLPALSLPGSLTAQETEAGADPPPAAAGAGGEGGPVWFPDRSSFAPLLAAPREVALRGGFVLADRPDIERGPGGRLRDFEGTNIEAEVALGHRIPVVRLMEEGPGRPELTLGFEVGVFTRFFMESPEKDLINADFRVGGPVSVAYRGWEGRLTFVHESSHFGDDFVERFLTRVETVTRDGFELLVGRRLLRDVRLYAGGDANFNVNRGVERTALKWGVEFDPRPPSVGRAPAGLAAVGASAASSRTGKPGASGRGSGGPAGSGQQGGGGFAFWPYAAADFEVTSTSEEVAGTAIAGIAVWVEGMELRFEGRGHYGPSPMGRFRNVDENFGGFGLTVVP